MVRRLLLYSAPVVGKSSSQRRDRPLCANNEALFNASCCFCLRRKAVYQRFGAPAGPSCQRKGLQDKGAWYVSLCLIRLPSSEKVCLKRRMFFVWAEYPRFNAGTDFQLQRITVSQRPESFSFAKECRAETLYSASVCEGKPCINASGPRPAFRRPGRWMQAGGIHFRR